MFSEAGLDFSTTYPVRFVKFTLVPRAHQGRIRPARGRTAPQPKYTFVATQTKLRRTTTVDSPHVVYIRDDSQPVAGARSQATGHFHITAAWRPADNPEEQLEEGVKPADAENGLGNPPRAGRAAGSVAGG
jgi:hypothetical protein